MQLPVGFLDIYDSVAPAGLVFARMSGLLLIAPVIGGHLVPMKVRALLALAFTMIVTPTVLGPEQAHGGIAGASYALAVIRELLVGLLLGFVVDMFFQAVRFGGDIIGRLAGFAAAETFNPIAESTTGPSGDLFYVPMMLIFVAADGHHHLIAALVQSFRVLDVGAFTMNPGLAAATVEAANQVFVIGLSIAFPVMMGIMAITVAEGVVSRAVPQINILHITFATKIMGTMVILYMGVPAAVAFMGYILVLIQELLAGVLGLL